MLLSRVGYAQFPGGNGEPSSPYQVTNIQQLQEVKNHPNEYFIQVGHIDASETISWNDSLGFEPIGTEQKPFTGYYNGNGYEIRNLKIHRPKQENIGLFGYTLQSVIRDVLLKNTSITGSNMTGGLAGNSINSLIINSIVQGEIKGRTYVGGLAGFNHGEIDNGHTDVIVNGRSYVGGISGINRGLIINSYSGGELVATGNSLGGISGNNYDGTISHSYSDATVRGKRITSLGGLAGSNGGMIIKSFATGAVSGNAYVGGLVGNNNGGKVVLSYSKGPVKGLNLVGGLAGVNRNSGKISESYTVSSVKGKFKTGGFAGTNESWIHAGYWAADSTENIAGISRGRKEGIFSLPKAQMTGTEAPSHMKLFSFETEWAAVEDDTPQLLWTLPYLTINDISTNEPLYSGEMVIFRISVTNTGGLPDSSDVILRNSTGEIIDQAKQIHLDPEQESILFFYWDTSPKDIGTFDFTVASKHHSSSFSIEVKNIPNRVELKKPISMQENVSIIPDFSWNETKRATHYHLQVAHDGIFTSLVYDAKNIDTTYYELPVSLNYLTEYYWRVRGTNKYETGAWSDSSSFTTIVAPPDPVELFSPEQESESVSTQPTFVWSSSEKAEDYIISLGSDEKFEEVFFDTTISVPDTSYTYERKLQPEKSVFWRVKATNVGGESEWSEHFTFTPFQTEVKSKRSTASLEYSLQQNYPNPFNPVTTIRYSIPEPGRVQIEVLNMLGQTVATLVNDYQSAGWHSVTFDGSELSSGFYIYRIKAKNYSDSKKLSLVK